MENKETKQTKTQVFNVVILDKSGSMNRIRQAAVDGFNETLAGIKKAQEKYADTQEHYVSLVTFCSCAKEYVFDRVPVTEAHLLTMDDFRPCCMTPLYDAMGMTLTSMRNHVSRIEDAVVVVTIITDGMENASKEYTGPAVKELVEQLKGEGWTFTYMGANQNSVEVAFTLSIRTARNFDYSSHGTREGMAKETSTRLNFFSRLHNFKEQERDMQEPIDRDKRRSRYTTMADDAFDDEEGK